MSNNWRNWEKTVWALTAASSRARGPSPRARGPSPLWNLEMPNPSAQCMLGKQEDWLKSYKGQLELQDFFSTPSESEWFLPSPVEIATSFSRETETKSQTNPDIQEHQTNKREPKGLKMKALSEKRTYRSWTLDSQSLFSLWNTSS